MLTRWGGKRALAMRFGQSLQIVLGGYGRFVAPVHAPVERLAFICTGNICRSPFGEQVALQAGMPALSMGLRATSGVPAYPRAVAQAASLGFDMTQHRATAFAPERVQAADLVLCFELWHALELERLLAGRGAAVRLLGAFLGVTDFHIHDPYGLSDAYLARCFETIHKGVGSVMRQLALPYGEYP